MGQDLVIDRRRTVATDPPLAPWRSPRGHRTRESERRPASGLRLTALAALALVVGALACSRGDEPLGGAEGEIGDPELAGPPAECNVAPIPALIDAQFNGGHRNAVRARCASIIRSATRDPEKALKFLFDLIPFIQKHSRGTETQQIELINALLCVARNETPGAGCTFEIPEGAEYNIVGPGGGGPFFVADGQIGYQLAPGWSDTERIVFTVPGPCAVVSPFDVYPTCAEHGTIPDGPFAETGSGILAHCGIVPDEVNTDNLRLARNIDDFNDPNAEDDGASEHFGDFAPPFTLPNCSPEITAASDRVAGARGSSSSAQLQGKRDGPSGVALADRSRPVGGQISAFSDWAVVDIGSTDHTIQGRVVEDFCASDAGLGLAGECTAPLEGAAADLFCGGEGPAGPTVITGSDGTFSFSGDAYDFEPGSTCSVRATKEGYSTEYTEEFVVTEGVNDVGDIALTPVPNSPPVATIDTPTDESEFVNCDTFSVHFTGTGTDEDGTIVGFAWTFPGGSPASSEVEDPGSVSWADAPDGTYTVTFDVTDDDGANAAVPDTVTIIRSCDIS